MDGWFYNEDCSRSSSSSGSFPESQFNDYPGTFSGSVPLPGLGCNGLELGHSNLTNLATTEIHRQIYQANMPIDITGLTSEDSIPQAQLKFFTLYRSQPSSSSSSLRSLSGSSSTPDCSSPLNYSRTSFMSDSERTIKQATQLAQSQVSPQQVTTLAYKKRCNAKFPDMGSDDEALTRAMLAVISSGSSSSTALSDQPLQHAQTNRKPLNGRWSAFKPYNSFVEPNYEAKPNPCSQKKIKKAICMLRMINQTRTEALVPASRPTSNQLQHVISERRRRETLNGTFQTLRLLLPPGSKKDKASVLVDTKNYLNTLKAQIADLEKKNQVLEMHLPPTDGSKELAGPNDKVKVQIFKASESTLGVQEINLRITVMAECDIIELVLHMLECLKEMRAISLASVDANTYSSNMGFYASATFTLQVEIDKEGSYGMLLFSSQAKEWDENWFKKAIVKAVDGVV